MSNFISEVSGSFSQLKSFVETDKILTALSDVGLDAAVTAMKNSNIASDRRSQIWSAINHLEQSEASLKKLLSSKRNLLFHLRPKQLEQLEDQRTYIRCLMAVCYRYLNEKRLLDDVLSRIPQSYEEKKRETNWLEKDLGDNVGKGLLAGAMWLLNPLTYIDEVYINSFKPGYGVHPHDVEKFKKAISSM